MVASIFHSMATFQIRSLTTSDGLSQSEVNNIMQDSYGYVWLSTTDGLNRTDGVSTTVMRLTPRNQELAQIYGVIKEDNYKQLWISISGDILIYNLSTEKTNLLSDIIPLLPKFDNNNRILIQMGNNDNVWLSDEFQLIELTNKNGVPAIKRSLKTNGQRVRSVFVDKRGMVWVALWDGLYQVQNNQLKKTAVVRATRLIGDVNGIYAAAKGGIFYMSYLNNYGSWSKISDIAATSLTICENILWIGTERGLFNIPLNKITQNGEVEATKIDINEQINVKTLTSDRNNQIWIGVDLGGARILNTKKTKFDHYKFATKKGFNNRIRSLHEDNSGNFWIGTRGNGIAFLPFYQTDYTKAIFLTNASVTTIGNSFCSVKNDVYSIFKSFSRIRVTYNGKTPKFEIKNIPLPKEEEILIVCTADPNGKYVWIGPYSKNLIRYDIEKDKTAIINLSYEKNIDPKSFVIRNIKFDIKGNMWIGTSNGLMIITVENLEKNIYKCKYYNNSNYTDSRAKLSGNYIDPIYFDNNNKVWIGTFGGGINYSDLDDKGLPVSFSNINNKYGFAEGTIRSILEDDKRKLWISSNKGLLQFNPEKEQIINYDSNDGLQDYEFGSLTSFKRKNGEMVFGGINGINVFRPDEMYMDTIKPKVLISDFSVFNKKIKVGEKFGNRILLNKSLGEYPTINLKYNENYFEIAFTAIHFVNPGKNQYKYRLKGLEKDWIYANSTNRCAKYTNVLPGEYTFEVLASNSDGLWTNNEATIKIIIAKAWWLSTFAIIVYLLVLMILLYFFSKYTVISHRKKMELNFAELEKNKIKEISELQANFFTNISHEFRTPLSLIISPIKQLMNINSNQSIEVNNHYELIYHNASILQRLINQLLDLAKYEKGKLSIMPTTANIVDFAKKTLFEFQQLAIQKQIKLELKSEFSYLLFHLDYTMFEHVLYNLLSNALKSTPIGGKITLKIDKQNDNLVLAISDTGIGIPKEFHKTLFERFFQVQNQIGGTGIGLSYSKILVEMNGGKISFKSENQKGTTFYIEFPFINVPTHNIQEIILQPELNQPTDIKFKQQFFLQTENDLYSLLIIDDDYGILNYLSDYFKKTYNVVMAANGREGLNIALSTDIDIIITDVMMPEMDGNEFVLKLKTNELTSHIPVIMLSAKTTNEDHISGFSTGADLYCAKPFDLDVLSAMLSSLLQNREKLKKIFRSADQNEILNLTSNEIDKQFLAKCMDLVMIHIVDENFSVVQMSSEMNITPYLLNKKLKTLAGSSANIFIRSIRLKYAAKLLLDGSITISEIMYQAGFSEPKYFRECFVKMFGVTPSAYRKKQNED